MILQTCGDFYSSLVDQLHTSRDEFERFESLARACSEMLNTNPGIHVGE